jgi:hypothetical protein
MLKDWIESAQSFFVRLRIREPKLVFRPRFQVTSILLWIFAIAGLVYGHAFHAEPSARPLSLLLSGIAVLGALFVIALHDTWTRFRIYGRQVWGLVWLIAFGVLASLSLVVWQADSADLVIKIVWTLGAFLVGSVGVRLTYAGFTHLDEMVTDYYPGMRSASILTALFLINYVLWVAQNLLRLIK